MLDVTIAGQNDRHGPFIDGLVQRPGATGKLRSVYVRAREPNLIEWPQRL